MKRMIAGPRARRPAWIGWIAFAALAAALAAGAAWAAPMQPFPLSQVRLGEGMFRKAMEVNRRAMDEIGVERALHCFRLQARLPTSAAPLGGWGSPEPYGVFAGHYEGHYLSALSLLAAHTGEEVLLDRVGYMVAELGKCQQALGGKFLFASPPGEFDADERFAGNGVPWYRMHKLMEGLVQAHVHAGNAQALVILENLAAWALDRMAAYSAAQFEQVIKPIEYGGMAEAFEDLYGITGKPAYRAAAKAWEQRTAMLDPLQKGQDAVGGHANTVLAKAVGAARVLEKEADPYYMDAMRTFWDRTAGTGRRTYATGGLSIHEGMPGAGAIADSHEKLPQETCVSYNMMKLSRSLLLATGDARYADYMERLMLNSILGSQDPVSGWKSYYQPLYANTVKDFRSHLTGAYCCNGTGLENFSKLGRDIWLRDAGNAYVNLFIASSVSWPEKGLTLVQTTSFPEEASSALTINAAVPVSLGIGIRRPAWCKGFRISVNGASQALPPGEGGYALVTRTWKQGDRIEIFLPMAFSSQPTPDKPTQMAFLYGPVVLVGEKARPYLSQLVGDVSSAASWVNNLASWFKPAGRPLAFTAVDGAGRSLAFKPYYAVGADEFFTGYFDVAPAPTILDEGNIALGRRTGESHPQAPGDNLACYGRASRAVDGMAGSWYSKWVSGGGFPSWMSIDLERDHHITRTEWFPPPTGERDASGIERVKFYRYRIEHSRDGLKWELYADRSANTAYARPAYVDSAPATARYLRITLAAAPGQLYDGAPPDIGEFKAFGRPVPSSAPGAPRPIRRFTFALPGLGNLIAIDDAEVLRVDILDIRGRLARSLEVDSPRLTWDGRDASGDPVAAGPLVVRALTSKGIIQRRFFRVW